MISARRRFTHGLDHRRFFFLLLALCSKLSFATVLMHVLSGGTTNSTITLHCDLFLGFLGKDSKPKGNCKIRYNNCCFPCLQTEIIVTGFTIPLGQVCCITLVLWKTQGKHISSTRFPCYF